MCRLYGFLANEPTKVNARSCMRRMPSSIKAAPICAARRIRTAGAPAAMRTVRRDRPRRFSLPAPNHDSASIRLTARPTSCLRRCARRQNDESGTECPVEAIFHEDNLLEAWKPFQERNAEMAPQCEVIAEQKEALDPDCRPISPPS